MSPRGRSGIGSRRLSALAAGLVVALIAGLALTLTAHQPPAPVTPREAIRAALHSPRVEQTLAGSHWDRAVASPIDPRLEQVNFYAGPRIVAAIALQGGRTPTQVVDFTRMPVPYGDWIAYEPAVLAVLCALFVVMAGVAPWRRLRNLDVAVTLSLVVSVVLFQRRYIDISLLVAAAAMGYLLLRCSWRALGPGPAAVSSTPLLCVVTPGLDPASRVRWLRVLLVALALVYFMIGVSSPDAVDVIYAVMEGATKLVHGVLPYGHLPPGIIHGDTYPILTYALYTPLALVAPVNSVWDSVNGGLAVAVLAALAAAWAVFRITAGGRPRARASRPVEVEEAGLRAALAWLAFPPLLITVSTGTTDVVLAAMLLVAILLWRRPAACAGMLAFAGWFKLAPFALVPVALAPLRRRRLAGAIAAVALVSLAMVVLLLALGGVHGPQEMLHAISYQFTRGSEQSLWSALGIDGLQPLAQGCVLGLIAAAVVKLRREPALAKDRPRMAALTAAILIGLQLSADYWAFLYLAWFVPMVGVSLLADRGAAAETVLSHAPLGRAPDPAPAISV
jgi:Glycosyltransferase family 87